MIAIVHRAKANIETPIKALRVSVFSILKKKWKAYEVFSEISWQGTSK